MERFIVAEILAEFPDTLHKKTSDKFRQTFFMQLLVFYKQISG